MPTSAMGGCTSTAVFWSGIPIRCLSRCERLSGMLHPLRGRRFQTQTWCCVGQFGRFMKFNKFRWNDHPARVKLKNTAAAVATEMFNRANMDGTDIYVNQKMMAKTLETSERTVRRALRALESAGLIHCTKSGSNIGRNGGPSEYVLTMPQNTGHPCPDHRTSVIGTPDTSDRLIEPLIDPGNRPGSFLSTTAGEDTES